MAGKGPLDSFYKDSLRFGNLKVLLAVLRHQFSHKDTVMNLPSCPQCFSHFTLYLKGREELVVTIYHGDSTQYRPPPLARITLTG
jgi:hypothetical protein